MPAAAYQSNSRQPLEFNSQATRSTHRGLPQRPDEMHTPAHMQPLAVTDTPDPKGKAGRKKRVYSHTKLGCKTCKTRKVRCDETWPSCRNCERYGIKCDGVRVPAAGVVQFVAPLTRTYFRLSHSGRIAPHEVAYLDMFRHRLIYSIIGDVTRPAWERMILQAIHEEPALCHAAVAYSALVGMGDGPRTGVITPDGVAALDLNPTPSKQLALRHYNQCIKALQGIVSRRDGDSVNVALLCILLCVCFELRFKNPYLALTHLGHSLQIVRSSTSVDDDLVMAFARMDMEASVFLSGRVPSLGTERLAECKPGVFGYQGLDNDLTCLTNSILTFIRVTVHKAGYHTGIFVPPHVFAEARDLSKGLENFRQARLSPELPDDAAAAMLTSEEKILWLKYLTIRIMLGSCLIADEMVYDYYVADLSALVVVAGKTVESQQDVKNKKSSIDMAVIPAVYLAAQKCRTPSVRRRALRTLAEIHDIEGVWDVTLCAKYAKRLMELEEEDLGLELLNIDELGPEVIPEGRRIHTLDVVPNYDNQYSTLTFHRRPGGLDDQWTTLVEKLPWQ